MQDPAPAVLAEVTVKGVARVRAACVTGEQLLGRGRQREAREDGAAAEGAPGLVLAFGAVADVKCKRGGEGGLEGDCAALAGCVHVCRWSRERF